MPKQQFMQQIKKQTKIVSKTTVRKCPDCNGSGKQYKVKKMDLHTKFSLCVSIALVLAMFMMPPRM